MKINFEIYQRLVRYCSYQERAISEVVQKMKLMELPLEFHSKYILELQEDGYLDEVRFANSYADGKQRIKGWGKRKISQHLKAKKVNAELIKNAIDQLPDEAYAEQLRSLAEYKLERTKGASDYERKAKVYRFLIQKGYESDLIHKVLFQ